jgi:hypothetical protein
MNSIVSLSREYRNGREKIQKLAELGRNLTNQMREVQHQQRVLEQEMKDIKTVIDFCVETGESPTQAKLQHTLSQMKEHLPYTSTARDDYSSFFLTPSAYTTGYGAITNPGHITLTATNSSTHGLSGAAGVVGAQASQGSLLGSLGASGSGGSTQTQSPHTQLTV